MGEDLGYIINHIFLPPKLPQKDDSNAAKNASLLVEVLAALESLRAHVSTQERSEWMRCIKMVSNMLDLRDPLGGLAAKKLETTLKEMIDGGTNVPAFGDHIDV